MSAWIVLLTVVLVTPEGQPDVSSSRRIETIDSCLVAAREWLDQDPRKAGGIGVAAACQKVQAPGEDG